MQSLKKIYAWAQMQVLLYNKRDDFDFEIVNFPILDSDVSTSYGVLIQFVRASSHVANFNILNKLLTLKPALTAIGVINFSSLFLNFISDTMI